MSIEAEKGMCRHDARAVCWMCSDQQAWWRDARIKAGYGVEPPNGVVRDCTVVRAVAPAPAREKPLWKHGNWEEFTEAKQRARRDPMAAAVDEYHSMHPSLTRVEAEHALRQRLRTLAS